MDDILSIVANVARELDLPVPTSLVGSGDAQAKQLLQCAQRAIREIRDSANWGECNREHTFSMVANTASYALPQDFDKFENSTLWNRTRLNQLQGPLTPRQWQYNKSWLNTAGIYTQFRVRGIANNQFYIHPTPTTETDGMAYEYQSKTCVQPTEWVAGYSVAHNNYRFNDGQHYQNYTGGVCGSTPPTHSTGSASDGGVTWSAIGTAYQKFTADTDKPLLPADVLERAIGYKYLQNNRLDYAEWKAEYENELRRAKPSKLGAAPISLQRNRGNRVPWPYVKDNDIL